MADLFRAQTKGASERAREGGSKGGKKRGREGGSEGGRKQGREREGGSERASERANEQRGSKRASLQYLFFILSSYFDNAKQTLLGVLFFLLRARGDVVNFVPLVAAFL